MVSSCIRWMIARPDGAGLAIIQATAVAGGIHNLMQPPLQRDGDDEMAATWAGAWHGSGGRAKAGPAVAAMVAAVMSEMMSLRMVSSSGSAVL